MSETAKSHVRLGNAQGLVAVVLALAFHSKLEFVFICVHPYSEDGHVKIFRQCVLKLRPLFTSARTGGCVFWLCFLAVSEVKRREETIVFISVYS